MQYAPEILTLSTKLTEDLIDFDDASWIFGKIEPLLIPMTQLLKGLPGRLMVPFVKVVQAAADCVQLMYLPPVSSCCV